MSQAGPTPGRFDVFVEIPRGSRNKYEADRKTGRIWLDRTLFTATVYPADYGFIPGTIARDGDPINALLLVEEPTFPGCVVAARPVGVFWMSDEDGPDSQYQDTKILCVPAEDPRYAQVRSIADLHDSTLSEITHFFDVYKDLEPLRSTSTKGWSGVHAARKAMAEAIDRAAQQAHEAAAPSGA